MSKYHKELGTRRQGDFRQRVLMRDGFRCQFERPDGSKCGKLGGLLEAHHLKALADGGEHHVDNGQTLCRNCHFSAHRLRPVDPEWTAWAAMLQDVLPTQPR